MVLYRLYFTENACYKAGRRMTVKGIMVHSTGANNPWLKRYVGPDDGRLGKNQYNNHWNTYHPGGKKVCVHGFIGKLADESIATYQTLPWDMYGWHAGGSANNGYIGFEICEDGLSDSTYFGKVYREAVELCAYLCKEFGLTEKDIICHSEGHQKGIASNHGDVMHWFPKHGKSMDTFRADVKALLGNEQQEQPSAPTIAAGVVVEIVGDKYSTGKAIPSWVKAKQWIVHSVVGSRVIINKSVDGKNAIMSPIQDSDLKVVKTVGNTVTDSTSSYTVVKGDTLWGIAKRLLGSGTRYTEIVKLNGLKTSTLYAGQKLKMPEK